MPFTYALAGETIYSAVDDKPKTTRRLHRLQNIAHHPDVAVVVDHYDEDWSELWWCRLRGNARVVDSGEDFEQGIRALVEKYQQYRGEPMMGPVIVVDVVDWTGWSASGA